MHLLDFGSNDFGGLLGMAAMAASGKKGKNVMKNMLLQQMMNEEAPSQGTSNLEQNYQPQASKYVGSNLNMPPPDGSDPVDRLAWSIGQLESGGKYGTLGPVTKSGDRAYGRYQVMGNNIPSWTKMSLGKSLSPQEFLSNPDVQDKVARHFLGQYMNKYGNINDAASMWFSGRPASGNNSKDILGTSVPNYIKTINKYYYGT